MNLHSSRRLLFAVLAFIAFVWFAPVRDAFAQNAAVRGFITDASTGGNLELVNVALIADDGSIRGAVTDQDGFFLAGGLAPGRWILRASFVGYASYADTLNLEAGDVRTVRIDLEPDGSALDEVVVQGTRASAAGRVVAGQQSVRPADIDLVPTPDVSGDLASYLTTLPGVVSTGDRGGQLFIRGGEPTHNMVLLDGMHVYQPFHVLGFFSSFPSDILSRADLYAGGYGSRYSGRVSSVLDVYTRDGNNRRFSGAISAAPFVSSVQLEGPIIPNRVSFLASVRESVIDEAAAWYVSDPLPYDFGDAFAKINAEITAEHQVSFSMLRTHDRGSLSPDEAEPDEIRWRNQAYGMRYLVLPPNMPLLVEVLVSYSQMDSEQGPPDSTMRSTRIGSYTTHLNMTYRWGESELNWGTGVYRPQVSSELGGLFQNVESDATSYSKAYLYLEPEFYVGRGLKVRTGVIGQVIGQHGMFAEPRLRVTWERGAHLVSLAGGRYHQEFVGLTDRRDLTNLFTAWQDPPTGNLTEATHALAGYTVSPASWLDLSVEAFYKDLKHLFISEWTSLPRLSTNVQEAEGTVKGLDLRLEARGARVYGSLNYGYSKVQYTAIEAARLPGEDPLQFRPPHDRRHQINALLSSTIRKFDVSARWNLGSGLPYNRAFGFDGFVYMDSLNNMLEVPDSRRVMYDKPYNGILPAYHRLDVSVERTFPVKAASVTVQAGVINVYNRPNIFSLDLFTLRRRDQLPVVPTVGLKISF